MTDTPWPSYQIGPPESIFALGTISVNYAQLEFATQAMFTTILGVSAQVGHLMFARLGPEPRDGLMRQALQQREWKDEIVDLVQRFIDGNRVCYENRNKLMHSNIFTGTKRAIFFFKTERTGKTVAANPTLAELRQVADDMKTYFDFGLHLSNMINELLGIKPQAGDPWYRAWPDKPALPSPLNYTSDQRPSRALD